MVDHVPFHELLQSILFWLCLTSYRAWHRRRPATGQTPPKSAKQVEQGFSNPKPFLGFIHKPLCAACEQTPQQVHQVSPAPPPLIQSRYGRPREVDAQWQYCPNPRCPYYGWVKRGNLHANGYPGGRPWRQWHCVACDGYFLETHGTLFHGKRVSAALLVRVVAALAEGLGIRAAARVFEVDPNTVLQWLVEAADQLQAFSAYLVHDVQVTQVQLDELFAVVSEVKAGHVSDAEAIERLERSPHGVWVAIDPVSKLLSALQLGERTLEMAQRLVHHVVQVLAPGCVPLFLTDGLKAYGVALLTHFGQWVDPPRQRTTGPAPKPRWMPRPELLYAQVVKTYRRRHLVCMRQRVVFGTLARVTHVLAPLGWYINTAFVERINLTLRQHVAAVGRRVVTLCKGEAGLRDQLHLYSTYYNFCLPHVSLRVPLAHPQPTKGSSSAKRWHPCTPAMAAGLTDRVWSLRAVLLLRVPPWLQPQGL
jgi:IS1 family transposase/transposase-like protein